MWGGGVLSSFFFGLVALFCGSYRETDPPPPFWGIQKGTPHLALKTDVMWVLAEAEEINNSKDATVGFVYFDTEYYHSEA